MSMKKKSPAALTKHIRLKIYAFIDTKMCLTHLTRLSKSEKERLLNSYFVRQGRSHTLTIQAEDLLTKVAERDSD